jgi:tetratricopeptide (TPR) repeat protein
MQSLLKVALTGCAGLTTIAFTANAQTPNISSIADSIRTYEAFVQQPDGRRSGAAWWKLAILYQDVAHFHEAELAYTNALKLLKTQNPDSLADVMDCLGTMYMQAGQMSKAEKLESDALTLREMRKDWVGTGISWTHLAMLSLGQHHVSDAAMYAQWAVDQLLAERSQTVATPEQKMSALIALALARCDQARCAESLDTLQKARAIANTSYRPGSFPVSYIDFLTGYAYWKDGNLELAAELMKTGTTGMQAELGWGHPTYLAAMQQYEHFLKQTDRKAEASEVRRVIARIRESR